MREARTYEEFMAQVEKTDPERFALVTYKYPVLTERQMETRERELEIPFSQLPEAALIGATPVAASTVLAEDTVRLGRSNRRIVAGARS